MKKNDVTRRKSDIGKEIITVGYYLLEKWIT